MRSVIPRTLPSLVTAPGIAEEVDHGRLEPGLLVAFEEGFEINLLGLGFGADPLDLTLRLPGLGRIGGS